MAEAGTLLRNLMRNARHKALPLVAFVFLLGTPLVASAAKIPSGFEQYAKTDAGEGQQCVVGDVTDEDAMNGRAYVYLENMTSHAVHWVTSVPLRPNRYQNRATHCLSDAGKIYALIQSDTSQTQELSQTFVDVVTLDRATGRIESTEKVIAKEAGRTPSTWVEAGPENFRRDNGKIVVTGKFFNLNNPNDRRAFSASPVP